MLISWEQREPTTCEKAEPSRLCLAPLSWLCEKGRKRGGERICAQRPLDPRHWARGSHTLSVVNPHANPSKQDYNQPCSWWKTWRSTRLSHWTWATQPGSDKPRSGGTWTQGFMSPESAMFSLQQLWGLVRQSVATFRLLKTKDQGTGHLCMAESSLLPWLQDSLPRWLYHIYLKWEVTLSQMDSSMSWPLASGFMATALMLNMWPCIFWAGAGPWVERAWGPRSHSLSLTNLHFYGNSTIIKSFLRTCFLLSRISYWST